MSCEFTYSIAIRTLGTAGEKYRRLLNSIEKQTIQPQKIIVVLPEGYEIPNDKIGYEEFVFSKKGMIAQRIKALEYIQSEYVLFCDDDVELKSDFVEKLAETLTCSVYSCCSGPLLSFFPPSTPKYFIASILGGACVMLHGRKKYYVRILKTGGWSYNCSINTKSHKIYETESLPWTCFMIQTDVMRKIHFEDELWAERIGYAAFEDRIMFYKLLVNGYKTCVVSDAHYLHNDGKTSTKNLKTEPIYAGAFNHYVFWHRYLYSLSNKWAECIWMVICIKYYIMTSKIYRILLILSGRASKNSYSAMAKGFQDARIYVKSMDYKKLEQVVR